MTSTTLPPTSTKATAQSQSTNPSRPNMSLSQTYLLAHRARAKLAGEASRPDHDLRRLVLHANTLDGLMLELADAEREQESWFNQSVKGAITPAAANTTKTTPPAKASNPPMHIQWADRPPIEEPGNDWRVEDVDSCSDDEDDDTDSDSGEEEEDDIAIADFHPLARVPSHKQHLAFAVPNVGDLDYDHMEVEAEVEEEEYYEDDEDRADLALSRSPSQHSAPLSPPELLADDVEDESEEESMTPPSLPGEAMPSFSDEHHQKLAVARQEGDSDEDDEEDIAAPVDKHSLFSESYYLRPRHPAPTGLVAAISVY